MEEMHRASYGERAQNSHAICKCTPLSMSPRVHQPGSSLNPLHLIFLGRLHYISTIG